MGWARDHVAGNTCGGHQAPRLPQAVALLPRNGSPQKAVRGLAPFRHRHDSHVNTEQVTEPCWASVSCAQWEQECEAGARLRAAFLNVLRLHQTPWILCPSRLASPHSFTPPQVRPGTVLAAFGRAHFPLVPRLAHYHCPGTCPRSPESRPSSSQGQGGPCSPNWEICEGRAPSGGHRGTAGGSAGFCSVQGTAPGTAASATPTPTKRPSSLSVSGAPVRHASQWSFPKPSLWAADWSFSSGETPGLSRA